ncbi:uncharacterized protein NEMAJ01_1442 [Nematocida major]|uniref:uncharacterized protein n=1 Tax=Nematocida major TaxID=1912982 RepID=UPI002008BFCF|nr:uncharacterized protein NEMAJ01_1442 [Nematocida major]KAH9386546.1 hypothetical protein NEMAJ01_1442 [Nematocida major]
MRGTHIFIVLICYGFLEAFASQAPTAASNPSQVKSASAKATTEPPTGDAEVSAKKIKELMSQGKALQSCLAGTGGKPCMENAEIDEKTLKLIDETVEIAKAANQKETAEKAEALQKTKEEIKKEKESLTKSAELAKKHGEELLKAKTEQGELWDKIYRSIQPATIKMFNSSANVFSKSNLSESDQAIGKDYDKFTETLTSAISLIPDDYKKIFRNVKNAGTPVSVKEFNSILSGFLARERLSQILKNLTDEKDKFNPNQKLLHPMNHTKCYLIQGVIDLQKKINEKNAPAECVKKSDELIAALMKTNVLERYQTIATLFEEKFDLKKAVQEIEKYWDAAILIVNGSISEITSPTERHHEANASILAGLAAVKKNTSDAILALGEILKSPTAKKDITSLCTIKIDEKEGLPVGTEVISEHMVEDWLQISENRTYTTSIGIKAGNAVSSITGAASRFISSRFTNSTDSWDTSLLEGIENPTQEVKAALASIRLIISNNAVIINAIHEHLREVCSLEESGALGNVYKDDSEIGLLKKMMDLKNILPDISLLACCLEKERILRSTSDSSKERKFTPHYVCAAAKFMAEEEVTNTTFEAGQITYADFIATDANAQEIIKHMKDVLSKYIKELKESKVLSEGVSSESLKGIEKSASEIKAKLSPSKSINIEAEYSKITDYLHMMKKSLGATSKVSGVLEFSALRSKMVVFNGLVNILKLYSSKKELFNVYAQGEFQKKIEGSVEKDPSIKEMSEHLGKWKSAMSKGITAVQELLDHLTGGLVPAAQTEEAVPNKEVSAVQAFTGKGWIKTKITAFICILAIVVASVVCFVMSRVKKHRSSWLS